MATLEIANKATANATDESALRLNGRHEPTGENRSALASLGAKLLRRAEENQAEENQPGLEAAWDELLASWGIQGEPVGIEQLRATIQSESG